MAQTNLNIRIDEDLKKKFENFCSEIGMNMTTAFCVFAKTAVREHRIPFEISSESDPFYNTANIERLEKAIADVKAGRSTLKEHEIIEAD
jgi:DNA-damage-inducible protein J